MLFVPISHALKSKRVCVGACLLDCVGVGINYYVRTYVWVCVSGFWFELERSAFVWWLSCSLINICNNWPTLGYARGKIRIFLVKKLTQSNMRQLSSFQSIFFFFSKVSFRSLFGLPFLSRWVVLRCFCLTKTYYEWTTYCVVFIQFSGQLNTNRTFLKLAPPMH